MAEDLTAYLEGFDIKVRYMHHDVDTIERMEIIRDLRLGAFDVLVGINLLREGLDIPEVSLVAILDADKEGFCAVKHHSFKQSAEQQEMSTARLLCTPTALLRQWSAQLQKPCAAVKYSRHTTRRTA